MKAWEALEQAWGFFSLSHDQSNMALSKRAGRRIPGLDGVHVSFISFLASPGSLRQPLMGWCRGGLFWSIPDRFPDRETGRFPNFILFFKAWIRSIKQKGSFYAVDRSSPFLTVIIVSEISKGERQACPSLSIWAAPPPATRRPARRPSRRRASAPRAGPRRSCRASCARRRSRG